MLRITKLFNLFLPALLGGSLLLSGCTDDVKGPGDAQELQGTASVPFRVATLDTSEPNSRAEVSLAVTAAEQTVHDVHVLFFEKDNTCAFVCCAQAPSLDNGRIAFPVPETLQAGKAYRTLIVGNADRNVPSPYTTFEEYVASMPEKYRTYAKMSEQLCAQGGQAIDALPMWGEYVDGAGNPTDFIYVNDEDDNIKVNGSVTFRRSVCRLEFTNTVANLKVRRVMPCNNRRRGFFFHSSSPASSVENYSKVGIVDMSQPDSWIEIPNWQTNQSQVLYAFPSQVYSPSDDDTRTLCVMIEGYYQDGVYNTDANPYAKASYYRLNVALPDRSQALMRNNNYRVSITSVAGEGAMTPVIAYCPDATVIVEPQNYKGINDNNITVEGFDPDFGSISGTIPTPLAFKINIACPAKYTVEVENNFDSNVDAYLTKSSADQRKVPSGVKNYTVAQLIGAQSGETVYLQVYRTGPGDADFTKDIVVRVRRKSDNAIMREIRYPVTIHTSCIIGDVIVNNHIFYGRPPTGTSYPEYDNTANYPVFVIPDRNEGASERFNLQHQTYLPAKNFSYNQSHICGGNLEAENDPSRWQYAGYIYPVCNGSAGSRRFPSGIDGLDQFVQPLPKDQTVPDMTSTIYPGYNTSNWDEYVNCGPTKSPWYKKSEENRWRRRRCYWEVSRAADNCIQYKFPGVDNLRCSKVRVFFVSDYRDKATGNYMGNYLPWVRGAAEVYGNYLIEYPFEGPSFVNMMHAAYYNFETGWMHSNTRHDGRDYTRDAGPERPYRYVTSAEWNAVRNIYYGAAR